MIYGCVFVIWSFNDCVNWASLLTIPTVNTFSHVDIVTGSSSWSIRTRLTFDCDRSSWASSSTKFTSNTSLLSSSISSQCVFSSEFRREWTFLIRIMHSPLRLKTIQNTTIEERIDKLRLNKLKNNLNMVHMRRLNLEHQ